MGASCLLEPGAERCTEPVVVNSSHLVCNAPRMRVGAYPVTVALNGVNSTSSPTATLHRLCDQDWFGLPGDECGACPEVREEVWHCAPTHRSCPLTRRLPHKATFLSTLWLSLPPLSSCVVHAVVGWLCVQNAECLLLFPVPLPRPGFYSQSLAQFTSCVPAAACPGVDAVLVTAQYRSLLAGGAGTSLQLDAILRQFFQVASAASANASHNASVGGGSS